MDPENRDAVMATDAAAAAAAASGIGLGRLTVTRGTGATTV